MGMSIQAVVSAGICIWIASVPAFSQTPSKPQQIDSHSRQAQEFLRKNQPDLAAREFAAILALDPNNVDAQANLGVMLFFQGDFAKATPHLRAAAKLRPNLWKIQALLGMSEKRLGQVAAAESELSKAFPQLQEEKLRLQAGMELIEIYYATGDLDKAAGIVAVLKQIAPENTDVLYTAHRIYSDLAGESMLSVAMVAPKSARMHQMMAQEMARQGNTEGAIAHYREAVKMDPHLPGLHFELAEALSLSTSADRDQVEKEYQAALSENPFEEKAESRLGEIALRASDLERAAAHYKRALEVQPNDADALVGMGRTLTQMHRPAEAEPYLKRAAQVEPFTAATHYRLSQVYRAAGRTADAQKELAEFQRLKEMKERLKQVYEEMRLQPVKQERLDTDVSK
jgi:tetratricopeptide (TPR) repeat protein